MITEDLVLEKKSQQLSTNMPTEAQSTESGKCQRPTDMTLCLPNFSRFSEVFNFLSIR